MQIRLDELLENMKSDAKDGEEDTGLFDKQEEGPKRVASCPPTPKRKGGVIEAAIDAATQALAEEQSARAAESTSGDDDSAGDEPVSEAAGEDDDAAENQFDDSDTGRHVEPPPEPRITAERAAIDPEMVTALEAEAAAEEAARAAQTASDEPAMAADEDAEEETVPERPVKQRTLSQKLAVAAAESEAEHYVEGSLSPLQGKKKGRVEHSGLIDVRQMAAAYLTQNVEDKVEEDEFATGPIPMPIGNESTSPLLLPQRQEAGSNKGLFIALAAVGLLAIIAGTALATSLFIDRGGRSAADMSAAQVAAFCEDEGYVAAVEPRASGSDRVSQAAVALPVDDQSSDSTAAALDQGSEVVDESDGETADEQTAAVTGDSGSSSRDRDSSSRDRNSSSRDRDSSSRDRGSSSRDRDSSSRDRDSSSRDDSTSASTGSTSTSTAETPKQPAGNVDANGVKCDEVLCLVEGKGCCGKPGAARPGGSTSSNDSAADANLPTRPERGDISSGMDKLQARLQSCGDRFGTRGAVTIKLKIEPSGKVSSASTGAGDGEFQACVSKIVKGAKFPATKQGASVTYPVVLR